MNNENEITKPWLMWMAIKSLVVQWLEDNIEGIVVGGVFIAFVIALIGFACATFFYTIPTVITTGILVLVGLFFWFCHSVHMEMQRIKQSLGDDGEAEIDGENNELNNTPVESKASYYRSYQYDVRDARP